MLIAPQGPTVIMGCHVSVSTCPVLGALTSCHSVLTGCSGRQAGLVDRPSCRDCEFLVTWCCQNVLDDTGVLTTVGWSEKKRHNFSNIRPSLYCTHMICFNVLYTPFELIVSWLHTSARRLPSCEVY